MRNSKPMTGLLALLLAACGSGDGEQQCTDGAQRCNGQVVDSCAAGAWTAEEDCAAAGKICRQQQATASCVDQTPGCSDGQSRCNSEVIENCTRGAWVAGTDCSADDKICEIDQDSGQAVCNEQVVQCDDGATRCLNEIIETCAEGMWVGGRDCGLEDRVCWHDDTSGRTDCIEPPCPEGDRRCSADLVQMCTAGVWQTETDCSQTFQSCQEDPDGHQAGCVGLHWIHLAVQIDDPVVVGTSLQLPIDGPSFGYDPDGDLFATRFDRDIDDPSQAFIWTLDGKSGSHYKTFLSGDPFPQGENFCLAGEDWCQMIGFDQAAGEWVFVGPSASVLMRVDSSHTAGLTPTSGELQPDSYIDRVHLFDWDGRRLLLYGATGPSSFSSSVYELDLDSGVWSLAVSGLRQVDSNCLALAQLAGTGKLYSFGGRETQDGGNTVQTLSTYDAIELSSGNVVSADMPAAIGARQGMSCAYDNSRGLIFVFGGALINDRLDEIQNDYHNDLWAFDPADDSWTQLMPDTTPGTFSDPDQYGDHQFSADERLPNFGKNRGQMRYDDRDDRLMIMGEVPIFTHAQAYFLYLDEL